MAVVKPVLGAVAKVASWPLALAGKGAMWMVKQPLVGIGKMSMGVFHVAGRHKLATGVMALGAGAAYVASRLRDDAVDQTRQQLVGQVMGQVPVGYGSAITPDEYALLEARMKQSGAGQTGFADAITAKRAAAAAPPTAAV